MQSQPQNHASILPVAVRRVLMNSWSDYHLNENSFPHAVNQETDEQQTLREEIVEYCIRRFKKKHPRVFWELREQAIKAESIDTETYDLGPRSLFDTVTDIFYMVWRVEGKKSLFSNETVKALSKEEPVPQEGEIHRIIRENLSDYCLDAKSFPSAADQETDQQRHLREEIVKCFIEDLQEKPPEVYKKISEKSQNAEDFDTGRYPFFNVVTNIFYQIWRERKEETSKPQDTSQKRRTAAYENDGVQNREETASSHPQETGLADNSSMQRRNNRLGCEVQNQGASHDDDGLVASPSDILDHILNKAVEQYPARYRECLTNVEEVKAFLMDTLRPQVFDVFARRDFSLKR